jgi:hypothetical protein
LGGEWGVKRWPVRLEDDQSCSIVTAHGDINNDGATEFVVGLNVYKMTKSGEHSYQHTMPEGHVILTNVLGERLAQRKIGSSVNTERLGRPGSNVVIAAVDGQMKRFSFDLGANGGR